MKGDEQLAEAAPEDPAAQSKKRKKAASQEHVAEKKSKEKRQGFRALRTDAGEWA